MDGPSTCHLLRLGKREGEVDVPSREIERHATKCSVKGRTCMDEHKIKETTKRQTQVEAVRACTARTHTHAHVLLCVLYVATP